jgi:tetratricopeptide (TPR) repeat protein
LKRKIFKKITGNWIEIIQNDLCSALDIPQSAYSPPVKKKEHSIKLPKLGERIDDYKKNIIHGRLWEECLFKAIAKECFENAEKLGEGIDKAKAKLGLARVCDRLYGKSKENIVTTKYQESYEIYKTQGIISEAAQCKIGLANFKRRALKQFDKAREECEEAKEMLESVKNKDEKYKLAYAECLSCLGLIYSKLGGEYIGQCDRLFNSSLDCRKEIGDIMGEAETENAMGLTKRNKKNIKINEIRDAIDHLENALDINESIGNYIGAAKNYRNLGLCYTDCINLVENETAKEGYFDLAKKNYESAIASWDLMKGDAPNEEIWEYPYRLGELEVNYGDLNEGIEHLQEVEKKWNDQGDWHNKARCLDLLCKAYNSNKYTASKGTEDVKSTIDEIIDIYKNVSCDENKLKQMKEDKDIFKNAVQILERTKEIIKALDEPDRKADAVDKILEKLIEKYRIQELETGLNNEVK